MLYWKCENQKLIHDISQQKGESVTRLFHKALIRENGDPMPVRKSGMLCSLGNNYDGVLQGMRSSLRL